MGLDASRVDQTFYSLGNEGLAIGVETVTGSLDLLRNQFSMGLVAETQKTNIGGSIDDPTDRINYFNIYGSYDGLGSGSLAQASLSFSASLSEQERLITPLGAPDPTDYRSYDFTVNLDSYGDLWSWGLGYVFYTEDDLTPDDLDFTSHEVNGYLSYSPSADFDVSGNFYIARSQDIFESWTDQSLEVEANFALIPGTLNFTGLAGIFDTTQPGFDNGTYVEGSLVWNVLPNAELVLSGRHAKDYFAGESGTDEDRVYSILLRANTSFLK